MTTLQEEWRPVPGFEEFYEVSDAGQIRRLPELRVLKPHVPPGRYAGVTLTGGGKRERWYVHRLVATAFLEGSGEVVRHLNHVRTDNRAANLAWGSQADNIRDAMRAGRNAVGMATNNTTLTDEDVIYIREADEPQQELADRFGTTTATISLIRRGRIWRHLLPDGWTPAPRRVRGSAHHQTTLTEDDVRAIRASNEPSGKLQARYGISKATVWRIRTRVYWQHVD